MFGVSTRYYRSPTSCLKHSPFSSLLMALCSKYLFLLVPGLFLAPGRQGRLGCWGEGRLMPQGAALNQQVLVAGKQPNFLTSRWDHSELGFRKSHRVPHWEEPSVHSNRLLMTMPSFCPAIPLPSRCFLDHLPICILIQGLLEELN